MGFLKKITPKNPPHIPFITSKPTAPKVAPEDPDDEITWFTAFSTVYYAFFGITLLVYPQIHASQQAPFPNPMAYWTKMSDDTAMAFRLAGSFMLALVGGPFCDEIFGTIGVKMKAFSMQLFLVNTFLFFVFIYYSFYDPLSTAIPLMWKGQAYFNGLILAWTYIEVTETANLVKYYTAFSALYFGGFSLGLSSVPDMLFAPPSPMAYWTSFSELSVLCARSLGLGIFALCAYGYFYIPTNSLCKTFTAINVVNLGLFIYAAYYVGPTAVSPMWEIQTCMQIPIAVIGLYLESAGATGAWNINFSIGGCGLNVPTMNIIDLAWFAPFTLGFLTVPNMLFGPAAISGVPLFTVDLDPVALWFGKAWGITTTILALGPYVFSVPGVKVAKMMAFLYLTYVANFIYGLMYWEVFNFPVIAGLTGVNFIMFALHLYVILPQQAGEPML
jgi:hypothetical protein